MLDFLAVNQTQLRFADLNKSSHRMKRIDKEETWSREKKQKKCNESIAPAVTI
jgi:hypothetical protein